MQTDREREHQGPDHSDKSGSFPVPATIPLFALPNVVLFPKTYLPLHIFEPRYREMVDDAVMGGAMHRHGAAQRRLGIGLLRQSTCFWHGMRRPPRQCAAAGGWSIQHSFARIGTIRDRSRILRQILPSGLSHIEDERGGSLPLDPGRHQRLVSVLEEYLHSRRGPPTWQAWFREDVRTSCGPYALQLLGLHAVGEAILLEAHSCINRPAVSAISLNS